jgi:two-component system, NarL family, sensor kinase
VKRARRRASRELAELHARLAEAEETLHAIRNGDVDAVIVGGKKGKRVFTLQGAEHAYRTLIESMNEGALTLTAEKTILYANACFAEMVKEPLEQVIGSSFRRFLSAEDGAMLRSILRGPGKFNAKIQIHLKSADGSQMPAQISIQSLDKNGSDNPSVAAVVTDLTDARRTEELLRALTRKVTDVQERERGRVALELHDNITQLLCAILFRSEVLVGKLSARDGPLKGEARKLATMVGEIALEVERISRDLRPGALAQLGLIPTLRDAGAQFTNRTGVSIKLACVRMTVRLPHETELALYRILQEALRNVEKHASARRVKVSLEQRRDFVQLAIHDDGVGFDPDHLPARRKGTNGLGLLGMRERAGQVGGSLKIKSVRRAGTEIEVRVPLPPTPPNSRRVTPHTLADSSRLNSNRRP